MMIYTLFGIFLISLTTPVHLENTEPKIRIKEALNQFIHTGIKPAELGDAVQSLRSLTNKTYKNEQICGTCQYVIDGVIQYRRSGVQRDLMIKLIEDLCLVFTSDGQVGCKGRVKNEIDAVLYMIDNRKNLTAARVCGIYFQAYSCKVPDLSSDWHVDIPEPLAEDQVQPGSDQDNSESRTVKLLHLTDIHFDPLYVPGSNAVCDKPLCCREGTPEKPENAAGYWGDYNVCDMPWHSVVDLMIHIKKEHPEIDYVYHTGDVIDHASWSTSKTYNMNNIKRLFDVYLKTFTPVPVYPILGNHEAHPCDYYAPENVTSDLSTQWLFDFIAEEWSKWLPADTKKTLKHGGYYTVLVKKGFRIIALNSNLWYKDNVWLIYDDVDPYGQLQWFADTLAAAEKNNEVVHILSHVPAGSLEFWHKHSDEFNRIIRRFAHIIKAHFNGHTHKDEIRIYLNDNKTNAVSVAYNGGSFTTFVGMNPNYRVYDMDSKTYEITNYDEWIYNMTEANTEKDASPNWYKLYSFKDAYGLNSTRMEDLFDWIQRMRTDPEKDLMKQYFRYLFRESEVNIAKECHTNDCLDTQLCYITSLDFDDAIKC